jgi:hypothetical protein
MITQQVDIETRFYLRIEAAIEDTCHSLRGLLHAQNRQFHKLKLRKDIHESMQFSKRANRLGAKVM